MTVEVLGTLELVESMAPILPLSPNLSELILLAKEDIRLARLMTGERAVDKLIELEENIRAIGAMVDTRAFQLVGWEYLDSSELHRGWANRTSKKIDELTLKLNKYKEIKTEVEESYQALFAIRRETNSDGKVRSKKQTRQWKKFLKDFIEQLKDSIEELDDEIECLREGYDSRTQSVKTKYLNGVFEAISEVREVNAKLLVKDYYDVVRFAKRGREKSYSKKSPVENLIEVALMLPADWIISSNQMRKPLLVRSRRNKLGKGAYGGYYSHWHRVRNINIKKGSLNIFPTAIQKKGITQLGVMDLHSISCERNTSLVHEFSHRLKMVYPIIALLEEVFYLRRTTLPDGSRAPLQESGYSEQNHFTRDGGFVSPYVGVDPIATLIATVEESFEDEEPGKLMEYVNRTKGIRYEVFTTGLGSFFDMYEDGLLGLGVKEEDKDHRHFILGLLAVV